MDIFLVAIVLVLTLAYANGTNDVSKAIATLVGGGVTNYRSAIAWGTAWTVAGAGASALVAGAMVATFSKGLLQIEMVIPPALGLSVLSGAIIWVLIASRTGLPVSTTHALTGAMVGAGLVAFGVRGLIWPALLSKIALPLLLSPALALFASVMVHPLIRATAARWEGRCLCFLPASRALVTIDAHGTTRTWFQAAALTPPVVDVPARCDRAGLSGVAIGLDTLHWLSSGLASFARGINDAPKIIAMLMLGATVSFWNSVSEQIVVFGSVALAMGVGSYFGGLRVTEVLAEKVTRMDHVEGLSANLITSFLVMVSATLGLPVSTTHVSSSAIIGIGMLNGLHSIRWRTVRDMVLAWIITLPAAGLSACLAYLLLAKLV
ncbi:MAG: inorganic phosphate transporter [Nitrospirales bacterium]